MLKDPALAAFHLITASAALSDAVGKVHLSESCRIRDVDACGAPGAAGAGAVLRRIARGEPRLLWTLLPQHGAEDEGGGRGGEQR